MLALILGFGLRIGFVASGRQNYDNGYPHGLGISILQSILAGDWSRLPTSSLPSTIGLANPAGASYLWALVAAFEPSAYAARAISAMLSVVGVAIVFDAGRRLFGARSALIGAWLYAVSPWSIQFAGGSWIQGQLEFFAVCTYCLLAVGLQKNRPLRVIGGLLSLGFALQTYVVAYILLPQALLLCLVSATRRLRFAVLAGLGVCLATLVISQVVIVGSPQRALEFWSAFLKTAPAIGTSDAPKLDTIGIDHSLRLISGRDGSLFGSAGAATDDTQFLAQTLTLGGLRTTVIDALVAVGILLAMLGVRRARNRQMLVWFGLPIAATITVAALRSNQLIHPFYLLTTAPAGYLLAALPLNAMRRFTRTRTALVGVLLASSLIPVYSVVAREFFLQQTPYLGEPEGLYGLTLKKINELTHAWQSLGCTTVAVDEDDPFNTHKPQDANWARSVVAPLRSGNPETWRQNPNGMAFLQPAGEQLCVASASTLSKFGPATFDVALSAVDTLHTYRPSNQPTQERRLTTNIGWQLRALEISPMQTGARELRIRQEWMVTDLPREPYADWYFAPFAKLIDKQGTVVSTQDGAPSIVGREWHVGDIIVTEHSLALPDGSEPHTYQLVITLFDPNQHKNAVFFDPAAPSDPILGIVKHVTVSGSMVRITD